MRANGCTARNNGMRDKLTPIPTPPRRIVEEEKKAVTNSCSRPVESNIIATNIQSTASSTGSCYRPRSTSGKGGTEEVASMNNQRLCRSGTEIHVYFHSELGCFDVDKYRQLMYKEQLQAVMKSCRITESISSQSPSISKHPQPLPSAYRCVLIPPILVSLQR